MKFAEQFFGPLGLVVLVIADGGRADVVVVEQFARLAGVLAGNQAGFPQEANRSVRHILEIPDGSRDQVERGSHHPSVSVIREQVRPLRSG